MLRLSWSGNLFDAGDDTIGTLLLHLVWRYPEQARAQNSLSSRRVLTLWPYRCEKKSDSNSDRNLGESMKRDLPWGIRARYEQHNR